MLQNAMLSGIRRDEAGQDLAEYGLLVALIAIVAIVGVKLLGNDLNGVFTTIASALTGAFS